MRGRLAARALAGVLMVAVTCLFGGASPASAATLASATWSSSSTLTSATGASYSYSFTTATAASLSSVTMTVPTGTGGTPVVGTVSPYSLAGGTASLSGTTLTYTFTAAQVGVNTAVSIQLSGLTNTSTTGSYTSTVTTMNGTSAVDTGTTGSFAFAGTVLSSPTWTASSSTVGATGTSYTYAFTETAARLVTAITMTVPPGTGGSPTVGTVTPSGFLGGSVALSGTTLTFSGISVMLSSGTAVTIQINGLTNTATGGHYVTNIATMAMGAVLDSTVASLAITGPLAVTVPGSLSWSGTLTGRDQSIHDTTTADQDLTVSDQTASGAGWNVSVAATTFTSGTHTLPNTGTLTLDGSVSTSNGTTAPTNGCGSSCVPPSDTVSYPVAITTAATSPLPYSIYTAQASSGLGVAILGGSSSANPVGWWLKVLANTRAGTYTSTVTMSVSSGP